MRSIRKRFGEAVVLDGVDLDVHAGEAHALAGENGAGKSTLMRIAAGIHAPDGGEITFCGREFAPKSPAHALRAGIAMAHQELSLAGDLSVAENILAGSEPRWGGFVDWKRLYQRAREMLAEFCPAIDAYAPVSSLGMGTGRWLKSSRRWPGSPKSLSSMSPRQRSRSTKPSWCWRRSASSRPNRSAWSISPTGWMKSSTSATASPCSATASGWAVGCARTFPRPPFSTRWWAGT